MTFLHLSFYSAFTLNGLGLAFHRTHLISVLLCLESMMLTLYLTLTTWTTQNQATSTALMPIFMLAFSACEAGIGLAILIASTRTHGSDDLHNLNALQC